MFSILPQKENSKIESSALTSIDWVFWIGIGVWSIPSHYSFSSPTSFVAWLVQFIVMGCADHFVSRIVVVVWWVVVSREYRRAFFSFGFAIDWSSAVCCKRQRFVREHAASVTIDRGWPGIVLAKRSSRAYLRTRIMYTVSKGPSKIVAKTRRGTKFGFLQCRLLAVDESPQLNSRSLQGSVRISRDWKLCAISRGRPTSRTTTRSPGESETERERKES